MNRLVKFLSVFGKKKTQDQQSIDPELEKQFAEAFRNLKEDDISLESDELMDKSEISNSVHYIKVSLREAIELGLILGPPPVPY